MANRPGGWLFQRSSIDEAGKERGDTSVLFEVLEARHSQAT